MDKLVFTIFMHILQITMFNSSVLHTLTSLVSIKGMDVLPSQLQNCSVFGSIEVYCQASTQPACGSICCGSLSDIHLLKPFRITVIIGMLYFSKSKSMSDIIRMCLNGNSKESEINLQSEVMALAEENLPNIRADFQLS